MLTAFEESDPACKEPRGNYAGHLWKGERPCNPNGSSFTQTSSARKIAGIEGKEIEAGNQQIPGK